MIFELVRRTPRSSLSTPQKQMNTNKISKEAFEKFLLEQYLFPDEDFPQGYLEDGKKFGAIGKDIFTFTVTNNEVISLEDIEPENLTLEDFQDINSGTDEILNWLDKSFLEEFARRCLIGIANRTIPNTLEYQSFEMLSELFCTSGTEHLSILFNHFKFDKDSKSSHLASARFVMKAIQNGIVPWENNLK
jgi:hypothetical protein